jgi:hypothetical protein
MEAGNTALESEEGGVATGVGGAAMEVGDAPTWP